MGDGGLNWGMVVEWVIGGKVEYCVVWEMEKWIKNMK